MVSEPAGARTSWTLPLGSSDATRTHAGGKGAALSLLTRWGFPVPAGFVITTRARRDFIDAAGLTARIAALESPSPRTAALEAYCSGIRALFLKTPLPPGMAGEILAAWRGTIHSEPAAVRSSAVAEDAAAASLAGQLETFLNVATETALLEAIRRCWSSPWSPRALAYRRARAPGAASTDMAVVVQKMVFADAAGVMFTIDPVTGGHDTMVINAAWGLGGAVVGGRVTPDTLRLERGTGRIWSQTIGDKSVMTVARPGGTADVEVPPARRHQPVLGASHASELASLGRLAEKVMGAPQDIEWAISRGAIRLLQSRVITAAAAGPPGDDDWPCEGVRPARPFDLWTRANVGEVWPEPVSPLVASQMPAILNEAIGYGTPGLSMPSETQWVKRLYGRIYYNEGAVAHLLGEELGLPEGLLGASLGSRLPSTGRTGGLIRRRLIRRLPMLARAWLRLRRCAGRLAAPAGGIGARTAGILGDDLDRTSDAELWRRLQSSLAGTAALVGPHALVSGTAMLGLGCLSWLLARWSVPAERAADLIGGLSGIRPARIGPSIDRIAAALRETGLGPMVLASEPGEALARLRAEPSAGGVVALLDRFLDDFGHRGPHEGEYLQPRWAEHPEPLIASIAQQLRDPGRESPAGRRSFPIERRLAATRDVEGRLDPLAHLLFVTLLRRVQQLVRLRENGRDLLAGAGFVSGRLYREIGRRWARRGWLDRPEDLSFLTAVEIGAVMTAGDPGGAGVPVRDRIARRRRAWEHWRRVAPPAVIGPDGRPLEPPILSPESHLDGLAASPGRAGGVARIVRDAADAARLRRGEILVARAADAAWTPAFLVAGALVLEIGGQLSHGAILAREHGVPAVVGARDATRRLSDGQTLEVDGTTGRVTW